MLAGSPVLEVLRSSSLNVLLISLPSPSTYLHLSNPTHFSRVISLSPCLWSHLTGINYSLLCIFITLYLEFDFHLFAYSLTPPQTKFLLYYVPVSVLVNKNREMKKPSFIIMEELTIQWETWHINNPYKLLNKCCNNYFIFTMSKVLWEQGSN